VPADSAAQRKGCCHTRGARRTSPARHPRYCPRSRLEEGRGRFGGRSRAWWRPADAGIVPGDIVLAVDGRPVASGADVATKIGSMAPGTAVKITILRDGSERTVSARLGELPVTQRRSCGLEWGLTLAPAANSQGVTITDVDPDGLGAEKGFAAGDIIPDVSDHPVHPPSDVHNAISRAQESGKRAIVMRVRTRNGGIQFMALPILSQRPTLWGRIQSCASKAQFSSHNQF
jgi:serine protease Do